MSTLIPQNQIKKRTKIIAFGIVPTFFLFIILWFFLRLFFCWGSEAVSFWWLCQFSPLLFIGVFGVAIFLSFLVGQDVHDLGSDRVAPEEELETELKDYPRIAAFLRGTESFSQKHPKFAKSSRMVAHNTRKYFRATKAVSEGYRFLDESLDKSPKRHIDRTALLLFIVLSGLIWLLFWGPMNFI